MISLRHQLGAVHALTRGEVIAYPTESVFGYGCDPFNEAAVDRLLRIKQRPRHKGLILVAANCDQIAPLLQTLTLPQRRDLEASWPGPVTWLIPDSENMIPTWIKGDFDSVAVRVSAHPTVQALCSIWGGPIVSTSANRSGQAPARSEFPLRLMRAQYGIGADYILPGYTPRANKPTEIRDLQSGRIIRAG
ncbi:L-threonylcarbamoyladenylate synthase [Ketobacter alkanivorans]|uniref:Threonylcarbamoyl-AMP synthase n=1 Tax=Ketobacter alkanivorans TaxID=1917421 RepID=A0A2K9LL79_9GAMM|nr:Sua5/YciO/YrdC/YwlC family protein [Ketobacter alkanivorans]AUM12987.1 tRNA threonylcarbamoyladenosine biosynthesis protein RimN [Ketobacter alkanivorans]